MRTCMLQSWRLRPPPQVSQHALVAIPAHHIGFWRYARRSDASPLSPAELINPFFVMIKLVPIATLELSASMNPIHLSSVNDVVVMLVLGAGQSVPAWRRLVNIISWQSRQQSLLDQ